ncbi:hypothetical protein EBB07_15110 [Paenibacillaceae bacterium]|nr:hypothetical protein EBB07_15110 [Paenibacillaceae bacterium]
MKLVEITLCTNRSAAIKEFYGTVLGLDILEDQPGRLSFRAGESVLAFRENAAADQSFYHIAFTIPTNKMSEAKQWATARGITLFSREGQEEFSFESWHASALYFYDPDDNLIEFIAHHTLDNASTEAFGPEQLLRISEIGLPVDDVPDVASKLKRMFQLEMWGGDGQQFTPLGDAEGVLIVVDRRRPWFPDGRVPTVFETAVKISGTVPASHSADSTAEGKVLASESADGMAESKVLASESADGTAEGKVLASDSAESTASGSVSLVFQDGLYELESV